MRACLFLVAAAALATQVVASESASAQAQAQAQAAATHDDIVVTAERLRQMVWDFVGDVSETTSRDDQLARWDRRICAGAAGLPARQSQFIVDRISRHADAMGLHVGAPGCRANVLVLVTNEPNELARALAERERYLMANYGVQESLGSRGAQALDDFVTVSRPVRWWHVMQSATADGRVLGHVHYSGGAFDNGANRPDFQIVRGIGGASRLERALRQDFRNVVIIVDAQQARGPTLAALADYLAMAALAQLNPGTDTSSYLTILNLFDGAVVTAPVAMTDWDAAYLQGLYDARRFAPNSQTQARDIRREMVDELSTTE